MTCTRCGSQLAENAKFCPICGTRVENNQQPTEAPPQQSAPPTYAAPPQQSAPPTYTEAPPQQSAPPTYTEAPPQQQSAPPTYMAPPQQTTPPPVITAAPPVQVQPPPVAPPSAPPAKKAGIPMAALIAVPLLIIAGIAGIFFMRNRDDGGGGSPANNGGGTTTTVGKGSPNDNNGGGTAETTTTPSGNGSTTPSGNSPTITYSYLAAEPTPNITYTSETKVYPSLYRTMDAIVTIVGTCDNGERDVLIEVEVPGFTQKYTQKVRLGDQITKLRIIPPLLTGDLNLRSEKTAQLIIKVTDADTNKVYVQDSKSITIASKFDIVFWDPLYGRMNFDNYLAWLTPDSEKVLELKRSAISFLEYYSVGSINSLIGYQDYGISDAYTKFPSYYFGDYEYTVPGVYDNTWIQAAAIQGAMGEIHGIRYNNSSFTIDSPTTQRVLLPEDVITSASGLCIETSMLMASALQSAGMHCMIVFPPGHAQVAVEAWPSTGDYFLIETTHLPMEEWTYTVMYLDKEDWWGYLSGEGPVTYGECYVVDCDLATRLNIVPMTN